MPLTPYVRSFDAEPHLFKGNEEVVTGLQAQVDAFEAGTWWSQEKIQAEPAWTPSPYPEPEDKRSALAQPTAPGLLSESKDKVPDYAASSPPPLAPKMEDNKPREVHSAPLDGRNPYAGVPYAWQLSETVDTFLQRLPPSRTLRTCRTPWIYICNPYWQEPLAQKSETPANAVRGCENEAPLSLSGTDLSTFIAGGMQRLQITRELLDDLRASPLPVGKRNMEVKSEQDLCAKDILGLAHLMGVRAGKVCMHEFQVPRGNYD